MTNDMKHFFGELFEYNYHANQKLIDIMMANQDMLSEKAIKLMSHVLNAHHIWNKRISKATETFKVWQEQPATDWKEVDKQNFEDSLAALSSTELAEPVAYVNSQGQAFTNSVRDILFHVLNHCNYHRAQIATELKNAGVTPPVTDYIFYKRK